MDCFFSETKRKNVSFLLMVERHKQGRATADTNEHISLSLTDHRNTELCFVRLKETTSRVCSIPGTSRRERSVLGRSLRNRGEHGASCLRVTPR